MEIAGRTAVVTGASSGIGAATAVELARRGANVVGVARRAGLLARVIDECRRHMPASVSSVHDISDRDQADEVVAAAHDRFSKIDILVNNAGVSLRKNAADTKVDEIEQVMAINFFGAVYLTMAVLPEMLERRQGSIVNVTSVAGYVPNPLESAYSASKAALSMWSHVLSVDLHDSGVHVGVVSPGPIDTEIWSKDEVEASYDGKLYSPDIVARAIVSMIEHERVHVTVPRQYGAVGALYPMIGRQMRWGLRKFEERGERKRRSR